MPEESPSLPKEILPFAATGHPSKDGEWKLHCPYHPDNNPSASVHLDKGWHCFSCDRGGSVKSLIKHIQSLPEEERQYKASVINIAERRTAKQEGGEVLSAAKVAGWNSGLLSNPIKMAELKKERGLKRKTVERFNLGWDGKRFVIPIYDADGSLVNLRKYTKEPGTSSKMINATGHGSPPRLYPIKSLEEDEVIITEGELDALILIQNGFNAISGTHGQGTWNDEWTKLFRDKKVVVYYDNDTAGRKGARAVKRKLKGVASTVTILPPPMPEVGSDATDWFVRGNGTSKLLRALLDASGPSEDASPGQTPDPPLEVLVQDLMNASRNGQEMVANVSVLRRYDPPYSVPNHVLLECEQDQLKKCDRCPMALKWDGKHHGIIYNKDIDTISSLITSNKIQAANAIREHFNIVKCNSLYITPEDNFSVEKLTVSSSIDQLEATENIDADASYMDVYNIRKEGSATTQTDVLLTGTTHTSPRDSRLEAYSWGITEAITSLDSFTMTKELGERLKVFRPGKRQGPMKKCWEISNDLAANATFIYGRQRLHIAMDLVWHSILNFPFEKRIIKRGWVELLVVGETRTGKTDVAIGLSNHYRLGRFVGAQSISYSGLVGGVENSNRSKESYVKWGEFPRSDRRMILIDEVSKMQIPDIGKMSDMRTRGRAQVMKINYGETPARVRSVWLSNPRNNKHGEQNTVGIDIVREVIGNDEDIARFDLAMSVSEDDVPDYNDPSKHPDVEHVYTSELCHDLILWCWTRTEDQVVWDDGAMDLLYKEATRLGSKYIPSPPLIQKANVREKIARLSVALAARTFSTDETHEKVVVTKSHVRDTAEFIDKLYSYDTFGYLDVSEREHRSDRAAARNVPKVKRHLRENRKLVRFLIRSEKKFKTRDASEALGVDLKEAAAELSGLQDLEVLLQSRGFWVIKPILSKILKEIEREPKRKPSKRTKVK